MMKVLHTSDWHLGHSLYGYDRSEEQQSMMNQMVKIVQQEQPDAMVVCGDVYDTAQPSAAVQRMFSEGMLKIHEACPKMKIVVTAGNHDSGSKHEINQELWQCLGVEMVGMLSREEEDWDNYIFEVPSKGFIVAVPYVYERNMPESIFQRLLDKVAERNAEQLPVVMMAHLTVSGSNFTGHEQLNERIVGGIEGCGLEYMGEGYDYLALGHIHKEQFINGSDEHARYSGTPIAVSFDEAYNHSVSVVEIEKHGTKPLVRTIDVNNPHPLVTLPTEGYGEWEDVISELMAYPDDIASYIRLNVWVTDLLKPGANMVAEEAVKGKKCKFCLINPCRRDENKGEHKYQAMNVEELKQRSPLDIAEKYAKDKGLDFSEELRNLFLEAMNEVESEKHSN